MPMELLDIQPRELKFIFELKKQSSCRVQLVNNSDQYVAFKVKTTSPKRYCVRPNTGILLPKSTCDFTVIMQAQRVPLPDMQCKDKFLIQSTVVPFGTTTEDITSSLFAKENGRYIEENKLKVVLVSPPQSPVLLPTNGSLKQEPSIELLNLKDQLSNGVENLPPSQVLKDQLSNGVENLPPSQVSELESAKELEVPKEVEELNLKMNPIEAEELTFKISTKEAEELRLKMNGKEAEELRLKMNGKEAEELKFKMNGKEAEELKLKMNTKEVEELKLKMNDMESKLNEAEMTVTWLREERSSVIQEKEVLKKELALLRKKSNVTKVQVGFPLLFVCFIALVSVTLGYMLRA